MRRFFKPAWILLALVFLFEAWLWEHLRPIVAWLVRCIRWQALKLRVAQWIDHLSPAATLPVFLVPVVLQLPLKFVGLWMLAHGSWLGAMATLAVAKLMSMGLTAFIFEVTRPKLLQIAWFRRVYDLVILGLEKAHALIDPIKARLRVFLMRQFGPVLRRLRSLIWLLRPKRAGRFMRRLTWLRRRSQRRAQAA
jgi:hypothetical protein